MLRDRFFRCRKYTDERVSFVTQGENTRQWGTGNVRNFKTKPWVIRPFIRYGETQKSVICGNLYENKKTSVLHWGYFKPLTTNEKDILSRQVPFSTLCGTRIKVRNSEHEPWKVRRFIDFEDLKTRVDEPDYHHRVCYAESALLTNEDYYNMQLS